MGNIIEFNPEYLKYRKMWIEDRWKVSGDLVRLRIKLNREGLTDKEERTLQTINRVVDENNGEWVDDIYKYR